MVITDWDEFQQSKKVELEHIWSILRIRQVCKYKKRLIEVLHSSRVLQLDGEYVEVLTDVQKPKELLLDNEDYQDDWGNDNSGWDSNDYQDDKDGWNSGEEPAMKKWKESFDTNDTTAVPSDSEIEIYEN